MHSTNSYVAWYKITYVCSNPVRSTYLLVLCITLTLTLTLQIPTYVARVLPKTGNICNHPLHFRREGLLRSYSFSLASLVIVVTYVTGEIFLAETSGNRGLKLVAKLGTSERRELGSVYYIRKLPERI